MKQIKYFKLIQQMTVVLTFLLGLNVTAFASGGGGGEGGDITPVVYMKAKSVKGLGDGENQAIFNLLNAKSRQNSSRGFSGSAQTEKELMHIHQSILNGDMGSDSVTKSVVMGLTISTENLGKAGQWSQSGMSFLPAAGWVTPGVLNPAAGAAIDCRSKNEPLCGVLPNATVPDAGSVSVSKLSSKGADASFNNAKFGGELPIGQSERDALKNALANVNKKAVNRAIMPNYINSPK